MASQTDCQLNSIASSSAVDERGGEEESEISLLAAATDVKNKVTAVQSLIATALEQSPMMMLIHHVESDLGDQNGYKNVQIYSYLLRLPAS
ncbi:hypothetical protein EB796_011689 [Bugula neritina]|uniref:Uncharacterized protein n=1 Tax=Bugula neritina TaxID=10212 RepID=A0A7J7JXD6_BUGNE|nr:hypothetical protein EB796_011689 [Bugula neritina]